MLRFQPPLESDTAIYRCRAGRLDLRLSDTGLLHSLHGPTYGSAQRTVAWWLTFER